jgi:diketogulonate reductase-like aldo/keto reductase
MAVDSWIECPSPAQAQSLIHAIRLSPLRSLSSEGEQRRHRESAKQGASQQRHSKDVPKQDTPVLMPVVGYGTYKLADVEECVYQAITAAGYRHLDTAFVYGGETTEKAVGRALQRIFQEGAPVARKRKHGPSINRCNLFVTTKQWRKYHGYKGTRSCLRMSLKRLQLSYVDLYLMHWPGPAFTTMNRRTELQSQNPWHYAVPSMSSSALVQQMRAETWRAMEDSYREGLVRAIGVCNFSLAQLQQLKETATLWPPAVNQIECHPLHPVPTDLELYCQAEGIQIQAYASLGGQDTGQSAWKQLLGNSFGPIENHLHEENAQGSSLAKRTRTNTKLRGSITPQSLGLLCAAPVLNLVREVNAASTDQNKTPAQILLRWALDSNYCIIPKASSLDRMKANTDIFQFTLSALQRESLKKQLLQVVASNLAKNNLKPGDNLSAHDTCPLRPIDDSELQQMTRLCWRKDPFRHLTF